MKSKISMVSGGELLATLFLFSFFVCSIIFREELPRLINWLGILIFLYAIYTWKKKTGAKWFNPYTILQLFFTMFNYGQPIMWAFGIHKKKEIGIGELIYNSGYFPSNEEIVNTQIYVCVAMLLFHIGAVLFVKRNMFAEKTSDINENKDYSSIKKAMKTVSCIVLAVVAPIAIYLRAHEVIIARAYGYHSLYYGSYSTQSGYIQILMFFFFPALVGYLVASDYSKKARRIVYIIFGIYTILGIMSGDRGGWLYSMIILLWLHTHYVEVSYKKYIIYGIVGIVGIYFLNAVTAVRNTGLASLSADTFLSIFSTEESPIVDTFFEMGGSMCIVLYFLHTGNKIYPYTNTYLTSILGVASSRILSFMGIRQVLIADWFSQDYLGLSWGTGFSMVGEAYVNGGYIGGLIYMSILGALHGKLLQHARVYTKDSPIRLFVVISGLNVIIGFARGALYLTLKELFYGVLIMVLLFKLVDAKNKKLEIAE